jgi:alkylated DNA repair dioxygenase AlkB
VRSTAPGSAQVHDSRFVTSLRENASGFLSQRYHSHHMYAQPRLFDGPETLDGGVVYHGDFIGLTEADKLFAALMNLEWRQHHYVRTGKAPRMYVWMGIPYNSPRSANRIVVTAWTPEALRIKALVEEKTGYTFDSLNLNLYRDHRDSIALHSDREAEGLWSFPIASVSLGAERRFIWRRVKDRLTSTQVLGHGSLLVMPPGFQRDYRHELPKQQSECGPRINLTFRRKVNVQMRRAYR